MSDEQEIVQSRFGYTNRFRFGEDQLKFTSRDGNGESTRSINYEAINPNQQLNFQNKCGETLQFSHCYHRHSHNDDDTNPASRSR